MNIAQQHVKVQGMDCASCAAAVLKVFKKHQIPNPQINYATGDVFFTDSKSQLSLNQLDKDLKQIGYNLASNQVEQVEDIHNKKKYFTTTNLLWVCLPFTVVLMLHMFPFAPHFLNKLWVQLALSLPVYILGMIFFMPSAYRSIKALSPNMNVLIVLGSTAAMVYSLWGALSNLEHTNHAHTYYFFETAASIITLVLLGNFIEEKTIAATQSQLGKLLTQRQVMANMIAFDADHAELVMPVNANDLRPGDIILVRTGEEIPADGTILYGEATVNESLLTGESLPILKEKKEKVLAGTIVETGNIKILITEAAGATVQAKLVQSMLLAQSQKPPIQQLADKISAVFVPLVLIITVLTFLINYLVLKQVEPSLMRSIAVMVIACPCAMGLATPAAIAVGLAKGLKRGIIFKDAKAFQLFKNIKQIAFDKTGTLTYGKFKIVSTTLKGIDQLYFEQLLYSIEKFSNHPIAQVITTNYKLPKPILFNKVNEIKGVGMQAIDAAGNNFYVVNEIEAAKLTSILGYEHNSIYLIKNNELLGALKLQDALRHDAHATVQWCKNNNLKPHIISGDKRSVVRPLAEELGIENFYAQQLPDQKQQLIQKLNQQAAIAFVGDGINDAPALAQASVGISLSNASQLAQQAAAVVITKGELKQVPFAIALGRDTYKTIKGNLFWAFAYNILAIPVAAFGGLHPTWAALIMAGSDVILIINCLLLHYKKYKL
jgi:P-type Cu+ transporter